MKTLRKSMDFVVVFVLCPSPKEIDFEISEFLHVNILSELFF